MTSALTHQRSVYVIKPEGMPFRSSIRHIIASAGLAICQTRTGILDEKFLRPLYPDLSPDLWAATMKFMQCGVCEVGLVEGDDAVQRLFVIAGRSTNPNDCEPSTIRGQFGRKVPDRVGAVIYFRNAIHRPKDCDEAMRDVALLSEFLFHCPA